MGELTKPEVRQLASDFQLPVAHRPESQDLCFLGSEDYRSFLLRYLEQPPSSGPIIDTHGNYLGQHRGLPFYTIGQRKGLGLSVGKPLYVIDKDVINNTLIVGDKEKTLKKNFVVTHINWIQGAAPAKDFELAVKVRYLSPFLKAHLKVLEDGSGLVELSQPYWDITPGQAAAFYQEKECLGGGMILQVRS